MKIVLGEGNQFDISEIRSGQVFFERAKAYRNSLEFIFKEGQSMDEVINASKVPENLKAIQVKNDDGTVLSVYTSYTHLVYLGLDESLIRPKVTLVEELDYESLLDEVSKKQEEISRVVEEKQAIDSAIVVVAQVAAQSLTKEKAFEAINIYEEWSQFVDKSLPSGYYIRHNGHLYQTRQEIPQVLRDQEPSINTVSLYEEVVLDKEGTQEDPIPYNNNMALVKDKYYYQGGRVYKCIRSTGQPVYNNLEQLVQIYVVEV